MFERLIDRMLEASWNRTRERKEKIDRLMSSPALATTEGPPTHKVRQFTVHDAMNGQYIEYVRRKYNPNAADDYAREIYIVQPGESLVDAISTVLVILEK